MEIIRREMADNEREKDNLFVFFLSGDLLIKHGSPSSKLNISHFWPIIFSIINQID